ncbi:MAG: YraN family protein [Bacteroidetes bacterium]|nr:YraN family protein [Bacteroidota bacterium]
MAKHLETGKLGEEFTVAHLQQLGFEILETNWRHRRCEVDIIAKDGNVLVFIEVKTRSYDFFGRPEEFISPAQQVRLAQAAAAFMEKTGHEWAVRFDVASVLKNKEGGFNIELIQDAFFPGL